MGRLSLSLGRTPLENSQRPSRTSWVFRRPPADPAECFAFRFSRLRRVLLYHVAGDISALRHDLERLTPPAPQRRRWERDYQALAQQLDEFTHWARHQQRMLRERRNEHPDTAWLRRQLDTLEPPR